MSIIVEMLAVGSLTYTVSSTDCIDPVSPLSEYSLQVCDACSRELLLCPQSVLAEQD